MFQYKEITFEEPSECEMRSDSESGSDWSQETKENNGAMNHQNQLFNITKYLNSKCGYHFRLSSPWNRQSSAESVDCCPPCPIFRNSVISYVFVARLYPNFRENLGSSKANFTAKYWMLQLIKNLFNWLTLNHMEKSRHLIDDSDIKFNPT